MKKKSIPVLALALTGVLATGCLAACGDGGNDQGEVITPETPITEQVDINSGAGQSCGGGELPHSRAAIYGGTGQ